MLKLAPFYLFACSVAAVKFYGHTPSADVHTDTLNRMAEALEDELSYGSMFISSDLTSKNGSDFLAEMGISDTTLEEFLSEGSGPHASTVSSASASPSSSLSARDPANQLNCQHNAVEDKISPKNQKLICSSLTGLVVSGVQGVAMLIDSQGCAEASSGHKVACKTMVALISGGGGFISGTEVLDYCTAYMSANDKKCSSQGVSGKTSTRNVQAFVTNTQADPKCSDLAGRCKEISA